MNCFCLPAKPADIRKTVKAGDNHGREFFTCRENKCDFFHWVGAPVPPNLYNRNGNNMNQKKETGIPVRIAIVKFEIGPPNNVWFSVNCPNTPTLVNYYMSIDASKREFSQSLKIWMFNIQLYNEVVGKLQSGELGEYSVTELPKFLVVGLKRFIQGLPTVPMDDALNLEPDLMDNLLPFQLEGIQFVVKRGGRALIGDEMGCGKTLQAIGVLQHYRNKWPAMVLVPVILLQQWRDELLKFSGDLLKDHDIVTLKKSSDRVEGRFKVLLVPYSILDKLVDNEKINPQMFGVVIADESHNLKSIGAQRTGAALPFLQRASVAVCLTGTPATNRPIELFTQLSGLLPNVFSEYDAFGKRYCDPKPSKFANTTEYKGSSNEAELKMILEGMVMIRRLKEDVVKSLPTKNRELRYVDPAKERLPQLTVIQKKSATIESDIRNAAQADKVKLLSVQRQLLLEHFKVTGLSKIPAIKEELARLVFEARLERAKAESNVSAQSHRDANGVPDISFTAEYEVAANVFPTHVNNVLLTLTEERLTQSVLDDDTVPLVNRNSRSSSIDSNDDEYFVVGKSSKKSLETKNKKRKRLTVQDDSDSESLRDSDSEYEQSNNLGNENEEWEWNVNPSKIRKSIRNDLKATKPKNAFDEMTSAAHRLSTSPPPRKASAVKESPRKNPNATGLGKKIIVFAHHQDVMDAIENSLLDLNVDFIRIDGGVTGQQRNLLIKRFQEDDVTDVALLSVTACGTGLNLTRANVALFGELYWSPGVVLQAEDRIHRLGQKSDSVRIIYMLGRNTADDIVWDQIQRKHQVLGATVGIGDHKSTHGGGMAIGTAGKVVGATKAKSAAYSVTNSNNSTTSSSSSGSSNPYQTVNPYKSANPYNNNGNSSNASSYSYVAAPQAPAQVPVLPPNHHHGSQGDGKIDSFFKPQSTKTDTFQYDNPQRPVRSTVPQPIAAPQLTAEQRERMERNKRAALEKLAQKKANEEQQKLAAANVEPKVVNAFPVVSVYPVLEVVHKNGHSVDYGSVVPIATSHSSTCSGVDSTVVVAAPIEYGSTKVIAPAVNGSSSVVNSNSGGTMEVLMYLVLE